MKRLSECKRIRKGGRIYQGDAFILEVSFPPYCHSGPRAGISLKARLLPLHAQGQAFTGVTTSKIGQASCLTVPLFSKEGLGEIIP